MGTARLKGYTLYDMEFGPTGKGYVGYIRRNVRILIANGLNLNRVWLGRWGHLDAKELTFQAKIQCDATLCVLRAKWFHKYVSGNRQMFTLMVLYTDSYLQCRDDISEGKRFFEIASRLPEELQEVLANRAAGLTSDVIPRNESFQRLLDQTIKSFQ